MDIQEITKEVAKRCGTFDGWVSPDDPGQNPRTPVGIDYRRIVETVLELAGNGDGE